MTPVDNSFFVDFGLILVFAVIAGMLSVKFRLPAVVGLLFVGVLIGPNFFGFVGPHSIDALAEIGAVLLLFTIGVEFSISKVLSMGLRALLVGFFLVFITFLFIYESSIILGFDITTSLYIAAIFSLSSTAIIVKILEQRGLIGKMEVPFLMAVLIVEDVLAVFMLTIFSSLNDGVTSGNIVGSILVSLGFLLFAYVVLKDLLKRFSDIFLSYQTEDTSVFFCFALGIGMSLIASALGLSPSIGAFLAGSIIASLPNGKSFEKSIKPFSMVFSSFFFLSIGMLVDPYDLIGSAFPTVVLISVFVVTVSVLTAILVYIMVSNARSAIFSGLAMVPLGEFSLLLAKESSFISTFNLVEISAAAVLITSLLSSLLISQHDKIYNLMKKLIPDKFTRILKLTSNYYNIVIAAFEPGGYFYIITIDNFKKIIFDFIFVTVAFIATWFVIQHIDFYIYNIDIRLFFLIIVMFIIAYPFYKIIKALSQIFNALVTVILRTTDEVTSFEIIRSLGISFLLFFVLANVPFINALLKLPRIFNLISLPIGLFGIFFVWSALRAIPVQISTIWGKKTDVFDEKIIVEAEDVMVDEVLSRKKSRLRLK